MDNPTPTGQFGRTVGTATCLDGADDGQKLFRVQPGNCCDHALEQASILMDCARRTSLLGVLDEEPVLVWASHYLGAMAKALMDDAHLGLRKAN